jgi:hypothetical protein
MSFVRLNAIIHGINSTYMILLPSAVLKVTRPPISQAVGSIETTTLPTARFDICLSYAFNTFSISYTESTTGRISPAGTSQPQAISHMKAGEYLTCH